MILDSRLRGNDAIGSDFDVTLEKCLTLWDLVIKLWFYAVLLRVSDYDGQCYG